MQNIIVFISPNIHPVVHDKIVDILLTHQIQITNNIDNATIIIDETNDIQKSLDDVFMHLKTKPFELHIYPSELAITKKDKIKHFVQRDINIKRFNKVKQFNRQKTYNPRHR